MIFDCNTYYVVVLLIIIVYYNTNIEKVPMANKRLDYDMIYELVMQCCKSSLSDRQWCLDNDIVPSTFYYWVRKLRQRACYDLPETECSGRNVSSAENRMLYV